ncbi:MAG: hypothetical protein PGN13_01725 [Patulibacter minatonensis]
MKQNASEQLPVRGTAPPVRDAERRVVGSPSAGHRVPPGPIANASMAAWAEHEAARRDRPAATAATDDRSTAPHVQHGAGRTTPPSWTEWFLGRLADATAAIWLAAPRAALAEQHEAEVEALAAGVHAAAAKATAALKAPAARGTTWQPDGPLLRQIEALKAAALKATAATTARARETAAAEESAAAARLPSQNQVAEPAEILGERSARAEPGAGGTEPGRKPKTLTKEERRRIAASALADKRRADKGKARAKAPEVFPAHEEPRPERGPRSEEGEPSTRRAPERKIARLDAKDIEASLDDDVDGSKLGSVVGEIAKRPTDGWTRFKVRGDRPVYHSSRGSGSARVPLTLFWVVETSDTGGVIGIEVIAAGAHTGTTSDEYRISWTADGIGLPADKVVDLKKGGAFTG